MRKGWKRAKDNVEAEKSGYTEKAHKKQACDAMEDSRTAAPPAAAAAPATRKIKSEATATNNAVAKDDASSSDFERPRSTARKAVKTTLMLRKKWSSNGEMSPDMAATRYYLPPTAWNEEHLLPRVGSKEADLCYVIFHGPSQSGKTTHMRDFCELLLLKNNLENETYYPVFVALKSMFGPAFWPTLGINMKNYTGEGIPSLPHSDALEDWATRLHKAGHKLVLIIDEADNLVDAPSEILTDFLTTLRRMKHSPHPPAAVFFVGRFLVTGARTLKGSPFNVTSPLLAPQFTLAEERALFRQYEEDVRTVAIPDFRLITGIVERIFQTTGGHPGLSNLCGQILHELVDTLQQSPTLEDWVDWHPFSKALDRYMATPNGRRMTDSLLNEMRCLRLALRLLRLGRRPLFGIDYDAAEMLAQEGIVKLVADAGAELFCPLVAALVRRCVWKRVKLPELPRGRLEVPSLLQAVLPTMDVDMLLDPDVQQLESSSHPKPAPRELVYSHALVLAISSQDSRDRITDIVISRGGIQDPERLFVLELGVNMDLTWKSPHESTKISELRRDSLYYHVRKTEEYHKELETREAWVLHFTTKLPVHHATAYPSYPRKTDVKVMHIYHDTNFTTATIYLPDRSQKKVSLLPDFDAPFSLENFLRDDAKIDVDGVREYMPLLKKNKVDEAGLHLIEDKDLRDWGVTAGLDRKKILAAIAQRTGKR